MGFRACPNKLTRGLWTATDIACACWDNFQSWSLQGSADYFRRLSCSVTAIPNSGVVWTGDKILTLCLMGRLRKSGILRAVSRIRGVFVFHRRRPGVYEYFNGRRALSVFGLRKKYLVVSHFYYPAGAFSVLPATVFAGSGATRVFYVHSADRATVFAALLFFFPHRAAAV